MNDEVIRFEARGILDGDEWIFSAERRGCGFSVYTESDAVRPAYRECVPLVVPLSVGEVATVIEQCKARYMTSFGKGNYD